MEFICKCRALFWYYFYQINKGLEVHYSFLYDELEQFLSLTYEKYYDMFNLIFCFYADDTDDKLSIYEPEFIDVAVQAYLLLMDDDIELLKIFDEIGIERMNKISELCTLFCEYLMDKFELLEYADTKIRQ